MQGKGPDLFDEVVAEGAMRRLALELEARLLVDVACGVQDVVGPQRQRLVAAASRVLDHLVHKLRPEAEHVGERLEEAVAIAKGSALEKTPLLATVNLNLGIVYAGGLKNKDKAVELVSPGCGDSSGS